jgi:hypothetical protein
MQVPSLEIGTEDTTPSALLARPRTAVASTPIPGLRAAPA